MKDITIQKRGGGYEAWSYDKLLASITKAGAELEVAEDVAKKVEAWVMDQGASVTSDAVRDQVIAELSTSDPAAKDSYQAYKKE